MNGTRLDNDSNPIGSQEDIADEMARSKAYFYQMTTLVKALVLLFFVAASAVTLVGNGLVIIIIAKIRRLQIPANITIVNLACYDFMIGLALIATFDDHKPLFRCVSFTVYVVTLLYGNMLGIGLSTINRYVAIVHPLRYNQLMTVKRTCILMGLCFLYALAWGIAAGIDMTYSWSPLSVCIVDIALSSGFVAVLVSHYIILFIIMTYCYTIIARIAWDHTVRMAAATAAEREEFSTFDAIMKKSKIILTVVGTSFILLVSHIMHMALSHIFPSSFKTLRIIRLIALIMNSLLNPIIYFFKYKDFRQATNELFGCKPSSVVPFQPNMG
ncbi:PREDICTED: histamine H2 receptor-like [Priapulus caudatus]|uniref:Histamine H2 receptor-like n=1 Tax=Priapulus caudatus TaxID=37621 RepID=A0ABM1DT67_PRICU|nr:PREDICTED: histamine H2 receptor-like [Priapulus caudatus]